MKFTELNILPVLESALENENIVEPTPIQIRASRAIFDGRDSYISSETGTGKTLAYLLPLLTKLNVETKELQVIILTPTHELASQIQDQLLRIKENSDFDFRSQLLIGSASMKRQLERLKKKPHIAIGSIGRILELIKKRKLKAHTVKTLVIDEADKILMSESLSMIDKITRSLMKDCQKIFVSATNQRRSNSIADEMSNEMVEVHSNSNQVIDNIEHIYFNVHENEKPELLRKIIRACGTERAIVFTHRNETAKQIAEKLASHKISVGEIHGARDKLERVKTINQFRKGEINILVASDIVARGLDVKEITHSFNVEIPGKRKDYLHRAGRTGRAGECGYCISLMSNEEMKIARRYQRELGIKMTEATIYDGVIKLSGR